MDQAEKERRRKLIKIALIVFTIFATFIFIGIFTLFAMSVKNMSG